MKISESHIITAIKGYLVGAANVVPGVSGGTFALITGIYQQLIDALNSILSVKTWKLFFTGKFKEFWKTVDGPFLLAFAFGVVISIFSLAKLITYTLAHYPVETWALFFGLILASSWYMFKDLRPIGWKGVLLVLAGAALGVVICTLSPASTPDNWWFLFLCGAIAICSMILPGISGSLILVLMCKYDFVMQAVSDLNIPVLLVFASGMLIGILAFSKFLHWLLARWERPTMLVLLGFVLGSLVKVWPWSNPEAIRISQGLAEGAAYNPHIVQAIIWCLVGIGAVILIELFASKQKKTEK